MWVLSIVLETFLLCRPLAFNWDTTIDGSCGERNRVYVSAGSLNIITDVMVLTLPMPKIWGLQLPLKRKLGLMVIFSLGILYEAFRPAITSVKISADLCDLASISIISVIRLQALQAISFDDPTFTLPMGLMWSTLEPELGIIAASLPIIRPAFTYIFPKWFGTSKDNSDSRSGPKSLERPQHFERIEDDNYPLTHMDRGTRTNEISGQSGLSHTPISARSLSDNSKAAKSGIIVRTEWNVEG